MHGADRTAASAARRFSEGRLCQGRRGFTTLIPAAGQFPDQRTTAAPLRYPANIVRQQRLLRASLMPQIAVRAGSFGSFLGFGELGNDFFEVVGQDVQTFVFSAGNEDFLFEVVVQIEHGSDPK